MSLKNVLKKEEPQIEKWKIVIWTVWWIWFLICAVLIINIFQNPVFEKKKISDSWKNFLEEVKNFHWSAKNISEKKKFFTWKQEIKKNFYLINLVWEISKIYEENWKISYLNSQEKELFLRKVAKEYTLKNIEDFRKFSTAEENVEKFSWRLLNKTIPVGFEVDMGELEWIFVKNIK